MPPKQKPIEERFWAKVNKNVPNGCWEWTGATTDDGYGRIGSGGRGGKFMYTHRLSYELHFGKIPDELNVLHECDNPPCVNPAHLIAGTQSKNLKDAFQRGRAKPPGIKGEKNGRAKLTEKEVKEIRNLRKQKKTRIEIAKIFGVGESLIKKIDIGEIWKHVN